jgi:rRNA maturation protein Nop10
MNILSLSRSEVVAFVEKGFFKDEDLKHYDICKELSSGKTQSSVSEKFGIDDRWIRRIKQRKCPDCGNSRTVH